MMNRFSFRGAFSLLLALAIAATTAPAAPAVAAGDRPALMPMPQAASFQPGALAMTGALAPDWSNCRSPALDRAVARLQGDIDHLTGVAPDPNQRVPLVISCSRPVATLGWSGDEGYRLVVSADKIRIDAEGPAGVIRAFATLRQLVTLRTGQPALSFATITDAPRFAWRGVMLDVARHFIEIGTIKRQIDAMERVKLNVLHLHLSDDQAFRVESRAFPKLTAYAADRRFYTQAEMRDLVAYAADRGILVVPEFDVPGHSRAIVESYPEIGARSAKPGLAGLHDVALNPASPATYRFLTKLVGEMARLFPGPYFHIGGDEVSETVWADNDAVKALMAREQLASKRDVESYFARRAVEIVRNAGKIAIGWEEISGGDLPADVIVQAWQSSNATAHATAKGHRTIVSAGYYLDLLMPADFHYAIDPADPSAAGWTPAEAERARRASPLIGKILTDALVAKPLPPLSPEQEKLILGGEAALWSEIVTDEMVDHRLWPRAAAIAERFWSPATVRDAVDMYRRLSAVQDQLNVTGLFEQRGRDAMTRRLAPGDADPVATLLDIVTPVRNMAHDHRILAVLRGKQIVQPLNALADAAPADSLLAHRFERDAARLVTGERDVAAGLRAQLTIWRDNHARFAAAAQGNAMLEGALPTSAAIKALAELGLEAVDAIVDRTPLGAAEAARADALLDEVDKADAASRKPLLSFVQKQPPADLIIAIGPAIRLLVGAARNPGS